MVKQQKIFDEVVKDLPENATEEEIVQEVLLRVSALRGLKDFEEGRFISHNDVVKEIMSWN